MGFKKVIAFIVPVFMVSSIPLHLFAQTTTITTSTSQVTFLNQFVDLFQKVIAVGSALNVQNFHPIETFGRFRVWFEHTTGTTLSRAWGTIKNIFIWFISIVLRAVHWIGSLLPLAQK